MRQGVIEAGTGGGEARSASPPYLGSGSCGGLARLTALLGEDVFFVPCEWGTKKPLVTYVERPFEGTKSPAYRALFESGLCNIAVYLGKASGGLCAIDFDADEDLEAFLAVNPKLGGNLQTRGSRGGMVPYLHFSFAEAILGIRSSRAREVAPDGISGIFRIARA